MQEIKILLTESNTQGLSFAGYIIFENAIDRCAI